MGLARAPGSPPEDAPETSSCAVCGVPAQAELDPEYLLSFPMRWIYRCPADHVVRRMDEPGLSPDEP